jgi:AAA15 family ATPase/GTPase
MLKSIHIKNFRLFRDLKIEPLNRVNLITGENDSGKTALLEAIYLLFGNSSDFFRLPSVLRSDQPPDNFDNFWKWLFHQKRLECPIEIKANTDNLSAYSVTVPSHGPLAKGIFFRYEEEGGQSGSREITEGGGSSSSSLVDWLSLSGFSTVLSPPKEDAEYFSRIAAKRGGEKRLIELLGVVEPRLQDLKYLKLGSQPLVYADIGMEDLIPASQLGQGFTRLLRLYSEILASKSNIVLIDEIENGIHYSAMPKVWKGIATIAREEDLQIFATTHSYECIRSAHEAFSSEPQYELALHRLERVGDDAKAVTYDKTTLETSIDMNLEVR